MDHPKTVEEANVRLQEATTGPELEALAQLGLREQNRWGRFALTALRRLGEYLDRTPRLRGRPKKESRLDSLPSLADLGITDRHLAAWAIKVAAVPSAIFDTYLRSTDTVTRAGLLAEAALPASGSVSPEVSQPRRLVQAAPREPELRVLQGDCAVRLHELDDATVDLVITSPPYADRRRHTYGGVHPDHYVEWFMPIADQLHRVLKSTGSFILNIKEGVVAGERSTYVLELILAMRKAGWFWTEEYIWHKRNSFPGKWPNRFRDGWERCLHFTKAKNFAMYQDAVMVPIGQWAEGRLVNLSETDFRRDQSRSGSPFAKNVSNWLGRDLVYPDNVLHTATECASADHSAAFPEELPEFFIKLFTIEHDLVLDPFLGSGTTLRVAGRLNRRGIGVELLSTHCDQARHDLGLEGSPSEGRKKAQTASGVFTIRQGETWSRNPVAQLVR
jgi:site-specific DNA-methyltransferase (adenine-specific)